MDYPTVLVTIGQVDYKGNVIGSWLGRRTQAEIAEACAKEKELDGACVTVNMSITEHGIRISVTGGDENLSVIAHRIAREILEKYEIILPIKE